ncbi:MAG: ATP-grasp domain-containing protein [bacterium]|nr:ATP-grasp domain-containing protein [bacterium]
MTILRTGSGSLASAPVLVGLKDLGVRVIAVDSDPLSFGLFTQDKGYVIPKAEEPNFIGKLKEICKKEKVDAILPAVDEEIRVLARNRSSFEEKGIRLIVIEEKAVETCCDKWLTYKFFKANGIPTPLTGIDGVPQGYPVVMKPRFGRGGKGIQKIEDKEAFLFFSKRKKDCIWQEYICGEEFTIDLLSDWKGKVISLVPRKRLATESGVSVKGIVERNKEIERLAKKIAETLKITGPSNIQCFWKEKEPYFTEINPRLAGGFALSEKAGARILENLVALLSGMPPKRAKIKEGVIMLRYYEQIFISKEDIDY